MFLCATGAEALYADMGHFGPLPIRVAWYGLVLPCLLLNYAGQAAVVVDGDAGANPFFALCPVVFQVALVGLATIATIIASQSIISGAYSMTAGHPARTVPAATYRADVGRGLRPVYIGFVNWTLMILTLASPYVSDRPTTSPPPSVSPCR